MRAAVVALLAVLPAVAAAQTPRDSTIAAPMKAASDSIGKLVAPALVEACDNKRLTAKQKIACPVYPRLLASLAHGESLLVAPTITPPVPSQPPIVPPMTTNPLAEPVFDSTKTMMYETDFESYTNAFLNPASKPSVAGFGNKLALYGTAPAGTNTTTQLVAGHTGQAVQFQYTGTNQESPGIVLYGVGAAPASSTTVVQYWVRIQPLKALTASDLDTTRLQIKGSMLWHSDPANNRIQFFLSAGAGGCNYNNDPKAQTKWAVWDLNYTGCNAQQPVYPAFPSVADGGWHRITELVKANTSSSSRDGRALMWIDGTLVIRVEQGAVGVIPAGAFVSLNDGSRQPWCVQADVDNLIAGYGVTLIEFGGPLTNGSTPFAIAIDDFKWWKSN